VLVVVIGATRSAEVVSLAPFDASPVEVVDRLELIAPSTPSRFTLRHRTYVRISAGRHGA